MVANESAYTWALSVFGNKIPLNMTQTIAPSVKNHVIRLEFDGTFYEKPEVKSWLDEEMTEHPSFPELDNTHREQLWVHQDTLNSFLKLHFEDQILPHNPIVMHDKKISDLVKQHMIELNYVCKDLSKCNVTLKANIYGMNNTNQLVSISQKDGIVVGDLLAEIDFYLFKEDSRFPTKMMTLNTEFKMQMNQTMQDFVFYPAFQNTTFTNTKLIAHDIWLGDHDFNKILSEIMTPYLASINEEYKAGVPITDLVPEIPTMVSGLLMNSTMSPYVSDGWLYAGFSMAEDSEMEGAVHELPIKKVKKEPRHFVRVEEFLQ